MKILIAGVGNLLRADDGFGVRVVQSLEKLLLPEDVRVVEIGISGISLVQEMMDRYDACVIVDAVKRDGLPGTLYTLEPIIDYPKVEDAETLHRELVDMHYAEPSQALRLARALGIQPKAVYVIGCEPTEVDELTENLSPPVQRAVAKAVEMIQELISQLQARG